MPKQPPSKTKTRIALNGLGRIGRIFLRLAWDNPNFEIAALHSRSGLEMYAHLLKYDSTYGIWDKEVSARGNKLVINGKKFPFVSAEDDHLPWKKMKIDIVVDATGRYTKKQAAMSHLDQGAKFMVCTAPMEDPDETFVFKANHQKFDPAVHKIVSAGSCTTVCSTLTIKVLEETFGIDHAFINTVHAFTSDQLLLDGSHKDWRRARGAAQSIIPTSSGVSKTIAGLYPHLRGRIDALALRVPVPDPSVVVLSAVLKKPVSMDKLKAAYEKAAKGELKKHLAVSTLPLVSIDFKGNPHGATVDLYSSAVVNNHLVNILSWYDNEWGYVTQTVYLLEYLAKRIASVK
jgi:glyceraldehyde 3-phosphate dehydrogenase